MDEKTIAVYRLFEKLHRGQAAKDITIDDWTLEGSHAARLVADEAKHVGCDVGDIIVAAAAIIAQDAAEYAAIPADEDAA